MGGSALGGCSPNGATPRRGGHSPVLAILAPPGSRGHQLRCRHRCLSQTGATKMSFQADSFFYILD